MIYESERDTAPSIDVRLIDFAHSYYDVGPDEDAILGVRTLLAMCKELLPLVPAFSPPPPIDLDEAVR